MEHQRLLLVCACSRYRLVPSFYRYLSCWPCELPSQGFFLFWTSLFSPQLNCANIFQNIGNGLLEFYSWKGFMNLSKKKNKKWYLSSSSLYRWANRPVWGPWLDNAALHEARSVACLKLYCCTELLPPFKMCNVSDFFNR